MKNKKGPCLEKKCSWCCDPVKIGFSKRQGFDDSILDKENLRDIWEDTGEILVPEENIDTDRIKTFKCVNYDKESGKCKDYERRPNICRNTSCVDTKSDKSVDEQHGDMINSKFFKIK